MADYIYASCALTAFLCFWLLLRAYRSSRYRILLWGSLCFAGFTVNNILLIIDKMYVPTIELQAWRSLAALVSVMILLYGLIWDTE